MSGRICLNEDCHEVRAAAMEAVGGVGALAKMLRLGATTPELAANGLDRIAARLREHAMSDLPAQPTDKVGG